MLAGPTPFGGATVSDLYADTSGSLSGSEIAVAFVYDNTTGALLISCTVNSTTKNYCSQASGGTAAAGDNIEVAVSGSGINANYKEWRVRFRD